MKEAAWQRVKEVFHEAVGYAGPERAAFVRTACGDDPVVFNEVSELLAFHDSDAGFLNESGSTSRVESRRG